MVDGFVSLSKGIYTIINLEHASRVKLRDASDRESAINCARYVLDEPVPEVEKVSSACSCTPITHYNTFNLTVDH